MEAFALTRAPRTPRGARLLELVLPPPQPQQDPENPGASASASANLRGFVTDPLPDLGVVPVAPEALELAAELPVEVTRDAMSILVSGQEAWTGDVGLGGLCGISGVMLASEGQRMLCAAVVEALAATAAAAAEAGAHRAADGLSFLQLRRHPAVQAERPQGQDERAFGSDLRAALALAIDTERAVVRVPGYFGPRFVAAAHAGAWRMALLPHIVQAAAEAGRAPDRLALPWLTVKDGRLHRKFLLRLLRSLVAAVQARPGLPLLELQQEFLPVLSFSELLVLLRACRAAGVLGLVRVETQAPGSALFGEARREATPCPGAEWRHFDDVEMEAAALGEQPPAGGWEVTVAAVPERDAMTRYGLLEMAIRAAVRASSLAYKPGPPGTSPVRLPVRKRPKLSPPPSAASASAAFAGGGGGGGNGVETAPAPPLPVIQTVVSEVVQV